MEKATCIINRLHVCMLSHFNWVQLFATLWTVACQVPLSQTRILEWVAMPSSKGSSYSVQFSSVQSLSSVWNTVDCSTAGHPVHHQLPEFTQTHVRWVSDAIQPSHSLLSPSSPAFNLSQYQGLFKWVSSSYQVAEILEFQLQQQSFQWIFRTDFL